MFLQRPLGLTALLAMTLLVSGCLSSDESRTDATATDEEGIRNVIFEEMSEYADPDVRWWDDAEGDAPPLAPIGTLHWRRELLDLDKLVEIVIQKPQGEPATADVTITADATGLLHLWFADGIDIVELTKDFDDRSVRSLLFHRVRPTDRHNVRHHGWRLVAMSGVEIASAGTTRQIRSVRIQGGDVDETITGVRDLVALEDLTRLTKETEITVTVDTGDATDSVFLHLRRGRPGPGFHGFRRELTNNGDGTFTGVWTTGSRPGPRHAVFDVLSHGTLYDDVEPYDNVAWGWPFVVERSDIDPQNDGA